MMASPNRIVHDEALDFIKSYGEKGAGNAVVVQRYTEKARKYEEYMKSVNYQGTNQLAKRMMELFPSNRDVIKILDVAAGTGLSGLALWEAGFRQIDAVDPSQGMLNVAREKNIYTRLICDSVDDKHQLDIPSNFYDAVTIAGGMGENQLASGAFGEIVRVVKPGGVVVNVTRVENYTEVDEYRNNLALYFRKLEDDGKWKEESRQKHPILLMDKESLVTTHRILS